jgi:hypothetical protein
MLPAPATPMPVPAVMPPNANAQVTPGVAAPNGQLITLANPRFGRGIGPNQEFSVDYQVNGDTFGGNRFFWIVKPTKGSPLEFQVTFFPNERSGTFKGDALVTPLDEPIEGPFEMYVEVARPGPFDKRDRSSNSVKTQ